MSKTVFVTLPDELDARVESMRRARSVGSALPPKSAMVRELVERGAAAIEASTASPSPVTAAHAA